jgi:hypothetical protein
MEGTLLSAGEWARLHFEGADLGDARSERRLVRVAKLLAAHPSGSLNSAIRDWNELLAAYRLLAREETTFEAVTRPHQEGTRANCQIHGDYLLIEDTTSLNYASRPATAGLGRIGDDRAHGLYLHSNLALKIEGWSEQTPLCSVMGLFHQKCWARTMPPVGVKEKKSQRMSRARESERWAEAYELADAPLPGIRWTHLGDRETDIAEVFARCAAKGLDWIIRTCQARALIDDAGSIFNAVRQAPEQGIFELTLRARPEQPARVARLVVRATHVRIRAPERPGQPRSEIPTNVVEVLEENPPQGIDPLHWVLSTSWPVETREDSLRVVGAYSCRPIIEEFHRALKSGVTNVEDSQLKDARALRALIGVLSPIALRLISMKAAAEATPHGKLEAGGFSAIGLRLLQKKYGASGDWTYLSLIINIARLGGFLARRGDGLPGWNTIWRGWHRLTTMIEGIEILNGTS